MVALTGYHIYRCVQSLAIVPVNSKIVVEENNVRHADLLGALGHLGQLCEVSLRLGRGRVVEEETFDEVVVGPLENCCGLTKFAGVRRIRVRVLT